MKKDFSFKSSSVSVQVRRNTHSGLNSVKGDFIKIVGNFNLMQV